MSEPVTSAPYLTLEMICGDAHAGESLKRCLRSVLIRSNGPLVDAIGLTFNGSADGLNQLRQTLVTLGYDVPVLLVQSTTLYGPVTLTLRQCPWPGRFDLARNDGWRHAKGEWVIWLDGDDEVCDAGTEKGLRAIERVERDYGIPPPPPEAANTPSNTLRTWLAQLPGQINVVYSPYDYTVDENDYVHVRQKMKRIVRRSAGHVWHSPEQSGIHEMLTAIGGVPEIMAETFGLLVQHHPTQAEMERVHRNADIVAQLTKPEILSDPRHAFDVANAALVANDFTKANEAISAAIVNAHNDMDRYVYRLARAYIGLQENSTEKMLQEAFAAVGILPEIRDAYFIAAEAFYRMQKWGSVTEWFERGMAKTPTLLSRDQPLAFFVVPRAQAALAYVNLGKSDKALELILQMEKEYPKAGLTVEVGEKVRLIASRQKGEEDLFAALTFLAELSPSAAAKVLAVLDKVHILDITRTTLRWKALKRKVDDAAVNGDRVVLSGTSARFPDGGVLNLDDVLDGVAPRGSIIQVLDAELDNRSAKVVSRVRDTPTPRRIAFYAPIGITRWECAEYDHDGMGGSESSVALLALELANQGHDVTVFTNKKGYAVTTMWNGVIQKDCGQFKPSEWRDTDTVVYCRAPWQVREDPPATKNIFCWHQDNGYANPWMWSKETAERQQHLHVSEFAKAGLLREAYPAEDGKFPPVPRLHQVLGNGISPVCLDNWPSERTPHSVIYASNPSRGLEKLLDAWPAVLRNVPDAVLQVACEWKVMLATQQDEPGFTVRHKLKRLQDKLAASPSTIGLGWLPQAQLLPVLKRTSIYCYPGGPMPEGFGVALTQAQACGCEVLAPNAGALSEVLGPTRPWLDNDLVGCLTECLISPSSLDSRRVLAASTVERHSWPVVAKRFLQLTEPQ